MSKLYWNILKAVEYNAVAWDDESIKELSESYELEMLYESARDTLSAQQKNDLSKFVRKVRTAEEVNTYMTGMLAKDEAKKEL